MAKAGKATNTDWIWLREARDLAAVRFGSKPLALKRLRTWMAAGKLPWIAGDWRALDAAGIEKLDWDLRRSGIVALSARIAFHNGDPQFWDAALTDLEIDVENNTACEAHGRMGGARAEGIKVSRTHLLELLPDINLASAADGDEAGAKAWITAEAKRMKIAGEIPAGITKAKFAKLLEGQIKAAALRGEVAKPVGRRHIANSLKLWDLWPVSSIK